jgi:anthranilate phosphoribosyltransferase
VGGKARDLGASLQAAADSVDSGRARRALESLAALSRGG